MPSGGTPSASRFAASFPKRFAAALADAQGAIAGIVASGAGDSEGRGLIDAEAMARLHEIYSLRVELEIETAGVLWRTAEVVCAMADTLDLLSRRRLAAADAGARRQESGLLGHPPSRAGWTGFGGASGRDEPEGPPQPRWPPRHESAADVRFGSRAA